MVDWNKKWWQKFPISNMRNSTPVTRLDQLNASCRPIKQQAKEWCFIHTQAAACFSVCVYQTHDPRARQFSSIMTHHGIARLLYLAWLLPACLCLTFQVLGWRTAMSCQVRGIVTHNSCWSLPRKWCKLYEGTQHWFEDTKLSLTRL